MIYKRNFLMQSIYQPYLLRFGLLIVFFGILNVNAFSQYSINFDGASDGTSASNYGFTNHNLNGITWSGVEAIIPTTPLAADWFIGVRSVRLRGYSTSVMTMTSNKANGIGNISFNYRRYGTDAQVAWRVEYSTDNGATWTQAGSDFTAPASNDVQAFSSDINVTGNARIRIIHASGGASSNRRLNIDDLTISDFLAPTLTSQAATALAQTSAILNGNISSTGGGTITRRGFKISEIEGFDTSSGIDIFENGTFSSGTFSLSASELTPTNTYYFQAYAENAAGRTYGGQLSFTTTSSAVVPTVQTNASTAITINSATLNAEVLQSGGEDVTSRGFVYSSSNSTPEKNGSGVVEVASGSGVGIFSEPISSLTNNTIYYLRAYAENTIGISYGSILEFITLPGAPGVAASSNATINSITANWTAPSNIGNQSFTYTVQISTANDFSSITSEQTGISSSETTYLFSGLDPNTEYYSRVRSVNSTGNSDWSAISDGYSTLVNAVSLTTIGTAYEQNFSSFTSSATVPFGWSLNATGSGINRLDYSGWVLGGNTNTGIKFSTISASTLGYQHTATTGVFTATLTLANNTGVAINALDVSYLGMVGRVNETRLPVWTVTVSNVESNALSYSTGSGENQVRSSIVTGLDIANGSIFTITWSSDRGESAGTSRQIGISNVSITPIFAQAVTNTPGFRLMSAPGNASYASMFSSVWLQGMSNITGNGSPLTSQSSNILTYNESTRSFSEVKDASTIPAAGTGFLYYHFNDDNYDGNANSSASVITVRAVENSAPTISLSFTEAGDIDDRGWHLIGNPFATNIDAFSITSNGNVNNAIYVYDRGYNNPSGNDVGNSGQGGGAYRVWNGTAGSLTNGRIAPFQAFWVKLSGPVADLELGTSLKTSNSAQFYKGPLQDTVIKIEAISELGLSEAWITVTEEGSIGMDSRDAFKLAPLDLRPYMSLATSAEGRMLDINNLPADLTSITELPLHVELFDVQSNAWTPSSGNVTLTWPEVRNFPSDWVLELVDARTGATVNMLSETSFEFEVQPALRKSAPREPRMTPTVQSADGSTALFLRVGPATSTSVETGGVDAPLVTELYGNYPNPFNPTTRIQYALPFASHVRLEVFDLMGRRVALLVDGEQRAGSQFVNFDASSLSSGVYVYRLTAAGQTLTRKMTLVK
jgi:hypothetical protein